MTPNQRTNICAHNDNKAAVSFYDQAADDGAVHAFLHDEDIKPIIQNRTFPVAEPETCSAAARR